MGQGIGFALTQAANISWDLRSPSTGGAFPAVVARRAGSDAGMAAVGAGEAVATEVVPARTDESRPHCGQTARLPDPVAWSETWQLGQRVFSPDGVNTGAGAGGGRRAPERELSGTAAAAGVGGVGAASAHRTDRRAGS